MKTTNETSNKRVAEGFAVTSVICAASTILAPQAQAQEVTTSTASTSADLPVVIVEDSAVAYKPERVASPKWNQPLKDIPQTITVVPKEVLAEQNATNLRDVLRNVPGVTMQAGEGGQPAGDNMSIRGFSARTDMFVDGIRDFGGYTRDPFMLEQVEVSKGPTGSNTGRGSTGGSVNLVSKLPHLVPSYSGTIGGGSDNYFRSTLDINQPLYVRPGQPTETPGSSVSGKGAKEVAPVSTPGQPSGIALRLNGLYHTQETAGRNNVEQERWGVNASLGFGLGTDTRFILSYFFLDQENVPDYGIPWVPTPSSTPGVTTGYARGLKPEHAPDVNFDNWYGSLERDFERTRTNIISAVFEHDFNDNISIRNQFRYGLTERDSVYTSPRFVDVDSGRNVFYDGTLNRQFQSRDQEDLILADQLDFTFKFDTGILKHHVTAGVEFSYENSENHARTSSETSRTNIFRPTPHDRYRGVIARSGAVNEGENTTVAAYVFDHVEIGDKWEVSGGLRWDWVESEYTQTTAAGKTTSLSRQDDLPSWRAGLVYKPTDNGSIYFGYGTSFNPSGEANTLSADNLSIKPEENRSYELGTKWNLFENRLQVSAALFRTEKSNARTSDPTDPLAVTVLDGEQVAQGFELGLAGSITDNWRIFAGYAYTDSEITSSRDQSEVGNRLANTPENTFNVWTVYDLPYGFQIGGGVQYISDRFNNNANTRVAPDYWIADAMVGYKINEKVSLQFNIHNLTDEDYIDRPAGGHFIPGVGRSYSVTASFKF